MDSYSKKAIFHLPGMFMHSPLYLCLLDEIRANPDMLKDNVQIGSIYGSPCGIWNGGRVVNDERLKNIEQLVIIRDLMYEYGIPVRFTFSNCLITEEHVNDEYCNFLLELFNTGTNEIICNSEPLEKYIRGKYGDRYKYISSTTKRLADKQAQLDEAMKDYHLVVMDYDHNQDYGFLKRVENKDKFEILCNDDCKPNCPYRTEHYRQLAHCQLYGEGETIHCDYSEQPLYTLVKQENFISPKNIEEIYLPMGFSNFKLAGRTRHPLQLMELLIMYLIKDEYALEIRTKLQRLL